MGCRVLEELRKEGFTCILYVIVERKSVRLRHICCMIHCDMNNFLRRILLLHRAKLHKGAARDNALLFLRHPSSLVVEDVHQATEDEELQGKMHRVGKEPQDYASPGFEMEVCDVE